MTEADCFFKIGPWGDTHDQLIRQIDPFMMQSIDARGIQLFNIDPGSEAPSVQGRIKELGLEIENSKFFVTAPNSLGIVHMDGVDRKCAINIPLTYSGQMSWYDQPLEPCLRQLIPPTAFLRVAWPTDEEVTSLSEISRVNKGSLQFTKSWIPSVTLKVDGPTVVNVGRWHQIDNRNCPKLRVIYSMRFRGNPTFDEVVQRFTKD